jgi:pyruvate dehydrogenase E2 component (dihydrolipoamide acetyltransferase)
MSACQREPRLNAWFDESNLALCQRTQIDLGIAMDAPEGLFVPVLKDIARSSAINLRKSIDKFKTEVKSRSISPEDLLGATFVLSNVGVFAGRYASPIVIPPMVAILAVGRMTESVVSEQGKLVVHKLLPLSLTVDHRVITGGEAARFLSALIMDLQAA